MRYWDNDGQAGNVVVMTVTIGPGPTYYYLSKIPPRAGKDHLGSVRMTIDAKGNVASYDNYYPFGEIMPGLSSNTAIADAKYKLRHQYYEIYVAEIHLRSGLTSKELYSETGLYYGVYPAGDRQRRPLAGAPATTTPGPSKILRFTGAAG